ncbi:molecular chaperone [Verrucomicrobiota bacterium]|jgi:HSP20 family protein|nr:molecular chaperone [Verrucomicrobiota bacterium]
MNTLARINPLSSFTRWNPIRDLEDMQRRFSTLLDIAPTGNGGEKEMLTVTEWSPSVDISEDDKEFLVKAELPDVKREDIKVNVENGVLTITGERKFEKEEKGKKYHRIERSYGSFTRSFTLPEAVKADKVAAEFKDGLLHVRLPKDESAKPKNIAVNVG